MKKLLVSVVLVLSLGIFAKADTTVPPTGTLSDQFMTSFLAHITASDVFRQDGSRVIKFADGIIQAIPYKGDHLLVASFGLIPHPDDATQFYKSYSIHAHVISIFSKYLDINPTYASILQDVELTPGYSYDTDFHHGGFDFSVGYAHQFGGTPAQ